MKGEKKNISIRRFDDLGRIVIPREIRRLLQYHDGDVVEIGTVGQSIVIDRCQPLSYMAPICTQYLAAFAKNSNATCIICDTNNVVAARGISIPTEPVLSAPVREHIKSLTIYEYSETDLLDLFGDGRYTVDVLYPVGKAVDMPMGAVLLLHYRPTTEKERNCARLLADILTELTAGTNKNIA